MPPRSPKGKSSGTGEGTPTRIAEDSPSVITTGGLLTARATFHGEAKSENSMLREAVPVDKAFLSTQDFKSLHAKAGEIVTIHLKSCSVMDFEASALYLRVWPASLVQKGLIILNSIWKSSFSTEPSSRAVSLVRAAETATLVCTAKHIIFAVEGTMPRDVASDDFRRHLQMFLSPVFLRPGMRLSIPWKAAKLLFMVFSVEDFNAQSSDPRSAENIYRISPETKLTCRSLAEIPVTLSSNAPSSSLGKATQIEFPGYPKQFSEALRTILFGIGQLKESSIALSRIRPPKGVLITGPHGVGKSRLLREIIRQLNGSANIEELSSEIILSRYIGDAESELRRVFLSAAYRAPSLVIIEDIDLVFKNRSSDASELQKRVVSCLLTLLDGIESSSNVVLLATSSRPNNLDPALRRAGRIDKEIELTIPLASDRYEILKKILEELRIEVITNDKVCVDELQVSEKLRELLRSRGHGMVASDLLQATKDAALIMLNSKGKLVETDELVDRMENLDLDCKRYIPVTLDALSTALTKVTPSTIRDIAVEVPQVLWSDIGGMQSLKDSLKEVVEWPLRFPHFFEKLDIRPPKGVLLYGPPGCSKTLMAKALATESHMNFLAVRGPELLSKWLGESEKAVQSLFKRARTSAPCVVFFDEIDALATKRGSSSSGVQDRVLSQLLTEIDGIQSKQGSASVIVVAATNRPDMLDPALLRPGRFDRKIYVPPPDVASRAQIVDIYLRKMPTSTDIIREDIVTGTEGFSGAEVVAVMTEAAVLAIDEGCSQASQRHFISSIGSIKPQITRDMLNFYDELAKRI